MMSRTTQRRAAPAPLRICDDAHVPERHVWADPFYDGDTCACGRFYLTLHADGFAAEVTMTPEDHRDTLG